MNIDLVSIMKAVDFAARKHSHQRRKDVKKTPYVNHPIEVATLLTENGITDVSVIISALLHDTLEDTQTTLNEIFDEFGSAISRIVLECTDDKTLNKVERKRLQIEHAQKISDQAKLVKLADKYSNLLGIYDHPPQGWTNEDIQGYIYWSYAVCKNCFGIHEKVDQKLKDLFTTLKVPESISDEELNLLLEAYYQRLNSIRQ